MSRFLALIMAAAMALFIAGPAVAQTPDGPWTVDKNYTFKKDNTITGTTDIKVKKNVNIGVSGDLPAEGKLDVQGDVVFKEMDVQVQDEEVVNKFFELDDSASSSWTISGAGVMNAAEQLQNGIGNFADISQNPNGTRLNQMNVGLQYQVGGFSPDTGLRNRAFIAQGPASDNQSASTNNFAKQIQIGGGNLADVQQFIGLVPLPPSVPKPF